MLFNSSICHFMPTTHELVYLLVYEHQKFYQIFITMNLDDMVDKN